MQYMYLTQIAARKPYFHHWELIEIFLAYVNCSSSIPVE